MLYKSLFFYNDKYQYLEPEALLVFSEQYKSGPGTKTFQSFFIVGYTGSRQFSYMKMSNLTDDTSQEIHRENASDLKDCLILYLAIILQLPYYQNHFSTVTMEK